MFFKEEIRGAAKLGGGSLADSPPDGDQLSFYGELFFSGVWGLKIKRKTSRIFWCYEIFGKFTFSSNAKPIPSIGEGVSAKKIKKCRPPQMMQKRV